MNQQIKQAVILAGGLGTRLSPFTKNHPKALYPISEKSFLEYIIFQLSSFGFTNILLLLGYKYDQIIKYINQINLKGLKVSFDISPSEYNTAGRLVHAYSMLENYFLLMYCDNYCPIKYQEHKDKFLDNNALIQLISYKNTDGYTKSNIKVNSEGKVIVYDKTRNVEGLNGVDIGYALVRKEALDILPADCADLNFEAFVYPEAVKQGRLYASVTEHRYYSIGSWERIPLTETFFSNPPTIFLDRDGTLNVRPAKASYVERPEEFQWLDGAREAVAALKKHGWRVLLFTNQPGIARGRLTEDMLAAIHDKMQHELREAGGEIDGIYVCPHDWDDGCDCRKPKAGLLYRAQKDLCLDLSKCVVMGDDDRDMEAGHRAGCRCFLVNEDNPLAERVKFLLRENSV